MYLFLITLAVCVTLLLLRILIVLSIEVRRVGGSRSVAHQRNWISEIARMDVLSPLFGPWLLKLIEKTIFECDLKSYFAIFFFRQQTSV
jgi:hypothetical protein